jgi:hypothetical protein
MKIFITIFLALIQSKISNSLPWQFPKYSKAATMDSNIHRYLGISLINVKIFIVRAVQKSPSSDIALHSIVFLNYFAPLFQSL